jgi:SepF-like predicted cell division protein (DUF552 family)
MSEENKVTQEELDALQAMRDESDKYVIELGRLSYQKTIIESQEQNIKNNIVILQQKELEFSNKLVEKYGNIKVDLETGSIY